MLHVKKKKSRCDSFVKALRTGKSVFWLALPWFKEFQDFLIKFHSHEGLSTKRETGIFPEPCSPRSPLPSFWMACLRPSDSYLSAGNWKNACGCSILLHCEATLHTGLSPQCSDHHRVFCGGFLCYVTFLWGGSALKVSMVTLRSTAKPRCQEPGKEVWSGPGKGTEYFCQTWLASSLISAGDCS